MSRFRRQTVRQRSTGRVFGVDAARQLARRVGADVVKPEIGWTRKYRLASKLPAGGRAAQLPRAYAAARAGENGFGGLQRWRQASFRRSAFEIVGLRNAEQHRMVAACIRFSTTVTWVCASAAASYTISPNIASLTLYEQAASDERAASGQQPMRSKVIPCSRSWPSRPRLVPGERRRVEHDGVERSAKAKRQAAQLVEHVAGAGVHGDTVARAVDAQAGHASSRCRTRSSPAAPAERHGEAAPDS